MLHFLKYRKQKENKKTNDKKGCYVCCLCVLFPSLFFSSFSRLFYLYFLFSSHQRFKRIWWWVIVFHIRKHTKFFVVFLSFCKYCIVFITFLLFIALACKKMRNNYDSKMYPYVQFPYRCFPFSALVWNFLFLFLLFYYFRIVVVYSVGFCFMFRLLGILFRYA